MSFVTFEEHKAALDRIARLEAQANALRSTMGQTVAKARVSRGLILDISGAVIAKRIEQALQVAADAHDAHARQDAPGREDPAPD